MCAFASAVPCDLLALLLQPACLPAYAAGKRPASRPAPCSVVWKAEDRQNRAPGLCYSPRNFLCMRHCRSHWGSLARPASIGGIWLNLPTYRTGDCGWWLSTGGLCNGSGGECSTLKNCNCVVNQHTVHVLIGAISPGPSFLLLSS